MSGRKSWTIFGEALGVMAGAAAILVAAGLILVAAPYMQLRDVAAPAGLESYGSVELKGREHYVNLGCVYCHTQQPRDPSQAPDGKRGWGRPSIPADYVYDAPHLLGTMRTGPDLLNIGARQPSQAWHLLHLYQPRAVAQESLMPAFPFLFDVVEDPADDEVVVRVPAPYGPVSGQVVARREALELTAYLLALDRTYPVHAEGAAETMP
ncbi:MAG: cbb3-type cytochrome c oxidase subunit II [Myxococcota bacterium]